MTNLDNLYVLNEIQVAYRPAFKVIDRPLCRDSKTVAKLFRDNWEDGTLELFEEVKVLMLNSTCRALGVFVASSGGNDSAPVDIRRIFSTALKCNATAIVICHNHPSGMLKPSESDLYMTNKIKEAGDILNIRLWDHVILTADSHYSFADSGDLL